ncbi:MAG: hypothetical protein P4L22_06135 [Candidatus Babeliales bacterium]|nr:hypothetical protein [Candidatus Babeliales bacterium]
MKLKYIIIAMTFITHFGIMAQVVKQGEIKLFNDRPYMVISGNNVNDISDIITIIPLIPKSLKLPDQSQVQDVILVDQNKNERVASVYLDKILSENKSNLKYLNPRQFSSNESLDETKERLKQILDLGN